MGWLDRFIFGVWERRRSHGPEAGEVEFGEPRLQPARLGPPSPLTAALQGETSPRISRDVNSSPHQTVGFSPLPSSLTASSSPLQQSYTSGLPSWAERQKQRWNLVKWGPAPGVDCPALWDGGSPVSMVLPSPSFYYSALLGAGCRYIRFRCLKKKQTKSFK